MGGDTLIKRKAQIVTLAVQLPDDWDGWEPDEWDWEGVVNNDDFEEFKDETGWPKAERVEVILVGVSK